MLKLSIATTLRRDTRWRSWLMHCATSWEVAGSFPDGVIAIFHWRNPTGRTMALGKTQGLTEMRDQEYSLGRKGGRCVGLTTLPSTCVDCLQILGTSTSWIPQGLNRSKQGLLYLCLQLYIYWLLIPKEWKHPLSFHYAFYSISKHSVILGSMIQMLTASVV